MHRLAKTLLAAAALALAACPHDDDCSNSSNNAFVRSVARDWYLYPELLPAQAPQLSLPPQQYLDALTAEAAARGWDRGWSYVASYREVTGYFSTGGSVGYGFSLEVRGTRLFVTQVVAGSAAGEAGFRRGDEIVAIGGTPAADLIAAGTIGTVLASSTPGTTRTFTVQPVSQLPPGPVTRTMTTRSYVLDPVPSHAILDRSASGLPPAGYVNLRTFISTAEPELRAAFAQFRTAGVSDVIVDLRYNGGGLVDTAEVLSNLLAAGLGGQVMFTTGYNDRHAAEAPPPTLFAPPSDSVGPGRIAFIMTGASASASELVANAMEPWREVAIVGARSYGKPVGQLGFARPAHACDLFLGLIGFRLANAQGDAGYYDGLPDAAGRFSGPLCAAEDDLTLEMGDPLEASTARALDFLANGAAACPPPAPVASALVRAVPISHPTAAEPTAAQRDVAGLF
jgi:carboxyl-terminal processing protease